MFVTAVVGANWGDEGKGKMVDFFAGEADVVVRFQGGRNAGHTIINHYGKFVLHLLPSGVFYQGVVNVLGPGVALDPAFFLSEVASLIERGVPMPRIFLSDRAQLVLPAHVLQDQYEEERLGDACFGSTRCGIAPFYADKYAKMGVQVADLYAPDRLRARIEQMLAVKNALFKGLYGKPAVTPETLVNDLLAFAEPLRPYVRDTTVLLRDALQQNKRIVLEGQLGALRDPDHGIYPFTTSSSPLAGFAAVGAGIPPHAITRIIPVAKAYSTCVGAGPFTTEIFGDDADELRRRGGDAGEFGATTGRPRRMGWFDAVATKYGCRLHGATEAVLSLLDVLGYLDNIPVCAAYELDGRITTEFPVPALLEKTKPVYEHFPGWCCDISAARKFDELPVQAQNYVSRIENLIETPVRWIAVGPHRDAILFRP